jgi:hypothetical protein
MFRTAPYCSRTIISNLLKPWALYNLPEICPVLPISFPSTKPQLTLRPSWKPLTFYLDYYIFINLRPLCYRFRLLAFSSYRMTREYISNNNIIVNYRRDNMPINRRYTLPLLTKTHRIRIRSRGSCMAQVVLPDCPFQPPPLPSPALLDKST